MEGFHILPEVAHTHTLLLLLQSKVPFRMEEKKHFKSIVGLMGRPQSRSMAAANPPSGHIHTITKRHTKQNYERKPKCALGICVYVRACVFETNPFCCTMSG